MSFFQRLQKPGHVARAQEKPTVRKETVKAAASSPVSAFMQVQAPSVRACEARKIERRRESVARAATKLKIPRSRKRVSAVPLPQFESESESDTSEKILSVSRKKARLQGEFQQDPKRHIRSTLKLGTLCDDRGSIIHASDIASLDQSSKFQAAFPHDSQARFIDLCYPLSKQRERYHLAVPSEKDDFNPLEDIREVVETVIKNYLPEEAALAMRDDSNGLLRRIKRAVDRLNGKEYLECLHEWNGVLDTLGQDGTICAIVDNWQSIDLSLLERILTQTYARTVSPRVQELRHYQNGTDNVYGELLPRFLSKLLKKDTMMKSDQIFVDLGSGVGNCVLQAALEVGCESWGCEMMDNACDLAALQAQEFQARCRLWGLSMGRVILKRGDFLRHEDIRTILPRADVILVNNQAFTPTLNETLTSLFLDLKDGARIISLKSFVPTGKKNEVRSSGAIYNILTVQEKTYFSGCVSWTDAPGTYYISRKDSTRIRPI